MLGKPWRAWLKFDPVRSLAELAWSVFLLVTGLTMASVIGWLSSTWGWYWQTFNWAGIAFAFLVTWLLFAVGVFLIGLGRRHQRETEGNRSKSNEPSSEVRPDTKLRLRLDPGGTRNYLQEAAANIHSWRQMIVAISGQEADGVSKSIVHTDTIALTFENAIAYERPIIDSFGHKLGGYNFFDLGNKGASFQFFDALQAPVIEIWFPPPGHYQKVQPVEASVPSSYSRLANPKPSVDAVPATRPYRLTDNSKSVDAQTVIRVEDGAFIPPDIGNGDFREYRAWLSAGYAPDPAQATQERSYAPRSPSDAEKEISIIDRLNEILEKPIASAINEAQGFSGGWGSALEEEKRYSEYMRLADSAISNIVTTTEELLAVAREVALFCEDDLCLILGNPQVKPIEEALKRLRTVFVGLHDVIDQSRVAEANQKRDSLSEVLRPHVERARELLIAHRIWANWTKRELAKRRRDLSKIASRQ